MKTLIMVFSLFFAANTVSFAQTENAKSKKTEISKTSYTCPMHQEEVSLKKGKCGKCGMQLVKTVPLKQSSSIKRSQAAPVKENQYMCSMCKDVSSKKPGKCPNCGMDMILKEEKTEHHHN